MARGLVSSPLEACGSAGFLLGYAGIRTMSDAATRAVSYVKQRTDESAIFIYMTAMLYEEVECNDKLTPASAEITPTAGNQYCNYPQRHVKPDQLANLAQFLAAGRPVLV